MSMGDYPLGAEYDSCAPWKEQPEREDDVEVWASITMSRAATMTVTGFSEEAPDMEQDDEGHVTYIPNRDYRDCNLSEQFKYQYFTIPELLAKLRDTVNEINLNGLNDVNLRTLNKIADESSYWTEDEFEVVLA